MRDRNKLGAVLFFRFGDSSPDKWECTDNSDGNGPFISKWSETSMGRKVPSDEELSTWENQLDLKKSQDLDNKSELLDIRNKLEYGDLSSEDTRKLLSYLLKKIGI